MIQWLELPLWRIERHDDLWVTKVDHTFVKTVVAGGYRDSNIRVEVHATDSGRLIGYTIQEKQKSQGPLIDRGTSYLGLFYSGTKRLQEPKGLGRVVYRDSNVRLLSFGKSVRSRDYMFVMRVRGKVDASKKE